MSVRPVNSSFIKSVDEVVSAYIEGAVMQVDKTAKCVGRLVEQTISSCCFYQDTRKTPPPKQEVTIYRAPVRQEGPTISVELNKSSKSDSEFYYAARFNDDPQLKMKYYKWAALMDYGDAQSELAEMYQQGGVRESEVLERFWNGCAKKGGRLKDAQLQIPLSDDPSRGQITIYDASRSTVDKVVRKGRLIRKARTLEQTTCYENMVLTDRFFKEKFKTELLPLKAYLDVKKYCEAAWEPKLKGVCFGKMSLPNQKGFLFPEVVAHEYSHGLIGHTCKCNEDDEPAALEESLADVFGIMTQQFLLDKRAGDPTLDWVIGKDYQGKGTHIRSFGDNPSSISRDEDDKLNVTKLARRMRYYRHLETDNGGAHFNSSIGNRAFFLAAKEDGNFAWEKIGQIWFMAMLITEPEDGFGAFAENTMKAAKPFKEGVVDIVGRAWEAVGVFDEERRIYRKAQRPKVI